MAANSSVALRKDSVQQTSKQLLAAEESGCSRTSCMWLAAPAAALCTKQKLLINDLANETHLLLQFLKAAVVLKHNICQLHLPLQG
jgi:hypothetical protein